MVVKRFWRVRVEKFGGCELKFWRGQVGVLECDIWSFGRGELEFWRVRVGNFGWCELEFWRVRVEILEGASWSFGWCE